jgi:histidyl-tRNA synthetase
MTKEVCFCLKADEAPSLPGFYAMAIELNDEVAVRLSGRSPIALPAGRYLYCGSAKGPGGLKARLSRHMRRGKSVRWHVDQLTEQGLVVGSWISPGGDECELVQMCSHLQCQLLVSAAVIARPAAVICYSGPTESHCPGGALV